MSQARNELTDIRRLGYDWEALKGEQGDIETISVIGFL